jgi:pilus assembly protein Flp/PilA
VRKRFALTIEKIKGLNKGQGILEYGLILVLIAMALIVAVGILGEQLLHFFSSLPDKFP